MNMMQEYWSEEEWLKAYPMSKPLWRTPVGTGITPMLYCSTIVATILPRAEMEVCISVPSSNGILKSNRTINDYLACMKKPCDDCCRNNYTSWTKEHPMLGVDAIHCECPEPQLLVLGYRCTVCLMANNKMKLEPSTERLQLDWEESDHERRQKLDKFDFTPPTVEKQEVFKNLRGEGWVDGCLGQKNPLRPCHLATTACACSC
jgi:hypothetical protein